MVKRDRAIGIALFLTLAPMIPIAWLLADGPVSVRHGIAAWPVVTALGLISLLSAAWLWRISSAQRDRNPAKSPRGATQGGPHARPGSSGPSTQAERGQTPRETSEQQPSPASAAVVDANLLEAFIPLLDLNNEGLATLASKTRLTSASAGQTLIRQGTTDDEFVYLVEGKLELEAPDGLKRILEGGSKAARHPLSQLKPHKYTVTALSRAKYFRVDGALLRQLLNPNTPNHNSAEDTRNSAGGLRPLDDVPTVDRVGDQLFDDIYRDLKDDILVIPSLPELALRIRRAIEKDETAEKIALIVQTNPAVTAKLIKVANSPLYHGLGPATDCASAIVRLGTDTTRFLVVSLTLQEVFRTNTPQLHKRMVALWQHSTQVAALSFVLAQATPGFDPERALLAGLVHDIGVGPILAYAANYPEVVSDPERLDLIVGQLKGPIGSRILRKWDFTEDLITTARDAENWYRDPGPKADYCDIVLIAQLHSFVGAAQSQALPRIDEVPAFSKLALGKLSPKFSLEILDEAKDRINEARKLLSG